MSIIPTFFMEATVALGRTTRPSSNPIWCATGFVVGRFEGKKMENSNLVHI